MEDSLGDKIIEYKGTQYGAGVASSDAVAKSALAAKINRDVNDRYCWILNRTILNPNVANPIGVGIVGVFAVKNH